MPPQTINIGLLWHSDSNRNFGVGALTVGNMAIAREAAARAGLEPRFSIFQPRDIHPAYVEGIAARHALGQSYVFSPGGFGRDVAALDVMLDIGAGDSFTDIYPLKRFVLLVGTKLRTRMAGVPLVFSPQTIGPFSRQPHTALAGLALKAAAGVFARDPLSFDAARALAPGARVERSVDVAFMLPFERAARGPGVRVGINVSGLLYNGGYTGRNEFGLAVDYRDFTHRLVEAFLAMEGVTVELIEHVSSPEQPRDDDGLAVDAVKARYPACVRVPAFANPSEAKSHISGLDFLVGARMHATIAAFSSGVPVVPVSYSRKFEGLFGGLGYGRLVPARGMSTEDALALTLGAFAERAAVAGEIAAASAIVEEGLERYRSFLADLFAQLKGQPR
jgi:polysaccharide pyruvyl transferase WcaK-like protein